VVTVALVVMGVMSSFVAWSPAIFVPTRVVVAPNRGERMSFTAVSAAGCGVSTRPSPTAFTSVRLGTPPACRNEDAVSRMLLERSSAPGAAITVHGGAKDTPQCRHLSLTLGSHPPSGEAWRNLHRYASSRSARAAWLLWLFAHPKRAMSKSGDGERPADVERLLFHLEDHRSNGLEALWELEGRLHVQARCLEHVEYIIREHAEESKEAISSRVQATIQNARRILSTVGRDAPCTAGRGRGAITFGSEA